jgi:hypothetical protein
MSVLAGRSPHVYGRTSDSLLALFQRRAQVTASECSGVPHGVHGSEAFEGIFGLDFRFLVRMRPSPFGLLAILSPRAWRGSGRGLGSSCVRYPLCVL